MLNQPHVRVIDLHVPVSLSPRPTCKGISFAMENAIDDVDGAPFALQAYVWADNNCGPTAWLVMVEWVVRACGVEIDAQSLVGQTVGDRGQQPHPVPSLENFSAICAFAQRLPQDQGTMHPFLPFTFHQQMDLYLGLGDESGPTLAERLFSCTYRRRGLTTAGGLYALQGFPVACVEMYQGRDYPKHFRQYVGCLVGPLPKLLHVELGSYGASESDGRVSFDLEGPPLVRVVYEFCAAVCSNGAHFITILGTRSGVLYDYDSMQNNGMIVKRAFQGASPAARLRGQDFRNEGGTISPLTANFRIKWCIYRLVESGGVAAPLLGLHPPPATPSQDPLQVQKSNSISPSGTNAVSVLHQGGDPTPPRFNVRTSARVDPVPVVPVPLHDMTSMSASDFHRVLNDPHCAIPVSTSAPGKPLSFLSGQASCP